MIVDCDELDSLWTSREVLGARALYNLIPHLATANVDSFRTHVSLPFFISSLLLCCRARRAQRPFSEMRWAGTRYRTCHCVPRPSGLSIEMYTISTSDPDDYSFGRVFTFSIVLSTRHDKYAITANAKASKSALALLTDVSVDGHEAIEGKTSANI
jgi:hypothetical protein